MNRGEDPFTADYSASWHQRQANEAEWASLRERLEVELRTWLDGLVGPQPLGEKEMKSAIASIAHLAYHFGAIRQITPDAKGPKAEDAAAAG
jgi:hypothetical protein